MYDFPASPTENQQFTPTDGPTYVFKNLHWTVKQSASGGAADWDYIENKPAAYPPDVHTHAFVDITGKPATYPPSTHTHEIADTNNLQVELNNRLLLTGGVMSGHITLPLTTPAATQAAPKSYIDAADVGLLNLINGKEPLLPAGGDTTHYLRGDKTWQVLTIPATDWGSISGKPATFPPSAHTHDWTNDITGKPATYAPSAHTHDWTTGVTGKPSTFAPSAHVHTIADVTDLQTNLDSRVLDTGDTMTGPLQLPAGSAAAASLRFGATAGTGLYGTTSWVGVTTAGTLRLFVDSTVTQSNLPISVPVGSAGAPGYFFGSGTTTGFFSTVGTISATITGTSRLTLSATTLTLTVPVALPADPASNLHAATKQYVDLRELASNKGIANGYCPLDATTKIASTYLPAYVDDVQEYANFAALPATGVTGIIYVTLDDNKTYRWGGSSYIVLTASPGSTDAVPEGSINLYYTDVRAAAAAPVQSVNTYTGAVVLTKTDVGLANVDNTSDAAKPVSTATATALGGKADTSHTHAQSDVTNLTIDLGLKAPLASPALTGTPTAPTAGAGTNTTQLATTAFVTAALSSFSAGVTISDTAPGSPVAGQLWWESDSANTFIYFNDGTSSQWVQQNAGQPGPEGPTGPQGIQGIQGIQGVPGPTDWASITGKPATYPYDPHTHTYASLTSIPSAFPPATHSHPIGDVTDLQTALDAKLALAGGTMTGVLQLPTGGAPSTPNLCFGAVNTGLYMSGTSLGVSVEGVSVMYADKTLGVFSAIAPTQAYNLCNKTYVDSKGVTLSDTAPITPVLGQLWVDTTTMNLYIYYDSFWVQLAGT